MGRFPSKPNSSLANARSYSPAGCSSTCAREAENESASPRETALRSSRVGTSLAAGRLRERPALDEAGERARTTDVWRDLAYLCRVLVWQRENTRR